MTTLQKVGAGTVILLVVFAAGRYSAPVKTITKIQTVEVEKKTDNSDSQDHKKVTKTETDKPDGTKTIVTVVTDDKDTEDASTDQTTTNTTTTKETIKESRKVNLSLLGGVDVAHPLTVPTYGLHISTNLVGPVTVGAFGLSDATVGLSIGLSF